MANRIISTLCLLVKELGATVGGILVNCRWVVRDVRRSAFREYTRQKLDETVMDETANGQGVGVTSPVHVQDRVRVRVYSLWVEVMTQNLLKGKYSQTTQ